MIKNFESFINESIIPKYSERTILLFYAICDCMEIVPSVGKEFKDLYVTSRNDDSPTLSPGFVISVEPIEKTNISIIRDGEKIEDTLIAVNIEVKLLPEEGETPIGIVLMGHHDLYDDYDNVENFDEILEAFNYKKEVD